MQKRKKHTEMEILSIPTAENQEEFITLPLYHGSTIFWVKNDGKWAWKNVGLTSWGGTRTYNHDYIT